MTAGQGQTKGPTPIILHTAGGVVSVVETWPEVAVFSLAVINGNPTDTIALDGDVIRLHFSNGEAIYRVTEKDSYCAIGTLQYGVWWRA